METLHPSMTVVGGGLDRPRLRVTGEVDASNADDLRLAILDAAIDGTRVEVDLAEVVFMDSTGVRALADAGAALVGCGSGVVLCNVPRQVLRLLDITHIEPPLEIR